MKILALCGDGLRETISARHFSKLDMEIVSTTENAIEVLEASAANDLVAVMIIEDTAIDYDSKDSIATSGIALLAMCSEKYPNLKRCLIATKLSRDILISAVNHGGVDFVNLPSAPSNELYSFLVLAGRS